MRFFSPEEVCAFLEKDEHTPEERELFDSPGFENNNLLLRPFGGFAYAPLRIPESIDLFVSPMGCARHCEADIVEVGLRDRFYRLPLKESELINGDGERVLREELDRFLAEMPPERRPKVITVTITCIDALLATDYSRTEAMLQEKYGIRMTLSRMFPLVRQNKKHNGSYLMEALYSAVRCPAERLGQKAVNVIGSSERLSRDTDFFALLEGAGYQVRQIHDCHTLEEYDALGEACMNVVINKHSVEAAKMLQKRFGMPYVEFFECFSLDEIRDNYRRLEEALGIRLGFEQYERRAREKLAEVVEKTKDKTWAVGGKVDYDPTKFMYDFTRCGFRVKYLLGKRFKRADLKYYHWYRENCPDLMIYPSFDLEMMYFFFQPEPADLLIGAEDYLFFMAPNMRGVDIGEEPYDFVTFFRALERIENALEPREGAGMQWGGEPSPFDRKWMLWN